MTLNPHLRSQPEGLEKRRDLGFLKLLTTILGGKSGLIQEGLKQKSLETSLIEVTFGI
jgi:hypothetical protein